MQFKALDLDYLSKLKGYKYRQLIRASDQIPSYSGIYIWRYWPELKSLKVDEFFKYIDELNENFPIYEETLENSRASIKVYKKAFGIQKSGKIFGISEDNKKIKALIEQVKADEDSRKKLADVIQCLIATAPPIYIGKADNIKKRLQDHFNKDTGFSKRLEHSSIPKGDIYISFIKDPNETINPSFTTGIEEILQRITNPPLTKRYG